MKLRIVGGLLLGIGLIGCVAFGAERTAPAKENLRAESSRDVPVQEEAVTESESTVVTEQEAPDLFLSLRQQFGDIERHQSPSPSLRSVETKGGTLAVLEKDGVVRLLAVAINHENPDSTSQGLAFSATITKDGVTISSVDKDFLARFVSKEQTGITADAGGVAAVTAPVPVPPPADPLVHVDCVKTPGGTTCLVVTETHFCICTVTGTPAVAACTCVPLA